MRNNTPLQDVSSISKYSNFAERFAAMDPYQNSREPSNQPYTYHTAQFSQGYNQQQVQQQ